MHSPAQSALVHAAAVSMSRPHQRIQEHQRTLPSSSSSSPPPLHRRRRHFLRMNMGVTMTVMLVALVATQLTTYAAAACVNASTLVANASDAEDAIAYTASCEPRHYRTRDEPDKTRFLNVSNLQLTTVRNYPAVTTLWLYGNELTTFRSLGAADDGMAELDLRGNAIGTLTGMVFPRRLTKLNLASNSIPLIESSAPWPASMDLKWLALDGNALRSIDADAFMKLTSLQYLSLSSTRLEALNGLTFPTSLTALNLSRNEFTSTSLNFSAPLLSLQTLDLSYNALDKFPDLSAFAVLMDLDLVGTNITAISGVRLPPKLKTLNLTGNAIQTIEIAQSDVKIMEQANVALGGATLSTNCKNAKAQLKTLASGLTVCVLSDDSFASSNSKGESSSAVLSPPPSNSSSKDPSALNDPDTTTGSNSSSSHMSSKAMLMLGLGCFGMGILVAAFVFLVKREKNGHNKPPQFATFAPELSSGSSRPYDRSADQDEYSNASWIFESPVKTLGGPVGAHNVVAILEDDRNRRGRGRSKVEDLLVYEIPLDEIMIKDPMVHKPNGGETLYKADYQGFQVVMHALLHNRSKLHRGKKRFEREFVEQVRLASMLEHLCIVQFIGVTFGTNSHSQQGTHKWKMGVVFEYMHNGSLAALFHEERTRREGKQYCATTPLSAAKASQQASSASSAFSWYPSPQTSVSASPSPNPQRCKMSIALDVAMGLVYLHSMGYVHGDLCAEKVLVNEQGEAKLSGMDISLQLNSAPPPPRGDVRASAVKARMKVMQVFQNTSISHSPAFNSSLLNSREAANGGAAPAALTSMTSSTMLTSANTRARRRAMQCDVYAFGLLLWELDTMVCVEAMRRLTAAATEPGEEHQMLRFSPECPTEVQFLARRCWHPDVKLRPSALDLQEELVRLLEGRLTRLSERSVSSSVMQRHRWSRRTSSSRNGSSSLASSGHSLGSSRSQSLSDFGSSSLVIAETEV